MEVKTKEDILKLAQFIGTVLDDKKAIDVDVIDVSEKTTLADHFVICSGNSSTQVKALAGEVEEQVRNEFGIDPIHTEGYETKRWILLDYGDVIVHVFHQEERSFYSLERLWQGHSRPNPIS